MLKHTAMLMAPAVLIALAGCGGESELPRLGTDALAAATTDRNPVATQAGVTVRRVSTGNVYDGFAASAISPDGRYVSFIDWSTGDLAVRDLRTGQRHRLTRTGGEAAVSLFAPDGGRIVYGWRHDGVLQLRVVEFDPDESGVPLAGEPTVILNNPSLEPYYLMDWSPDGSQILAKVYLMPAGTSNQLALISTTDGTYRALKSYDWREPDRAAFSPDGRFVAYDFPPDPDSPNRDVFVVSLDGMYEGRVVEGPAVVLDWHPDGSILFQSDRGGTPGMWRIPMSDGRPAGPAELVRADMWDLAPLGFVGDAFHYGVSVPDPSGGMYTVDVDYASGERTGQPVLVRDFQEGEPWGWGWSPDGRYLAYARMTGETGASEILIRSDADEEVKSFDLDLTGRFGFLRWHPDGQSLIVFARDDKGRFGFYRINLESASYTTIVRSDQLEVPVRPPGYFDVSADGRTLWFVTVDYGFDPWRFHLVAYDLETGDSRPVRLEDASLAAARVSVSPDGSTLAIVATDSSGRWIGTVPVDGGPFAALARFEADVLIRSVEWTPDGSGLVVTTVSTEDWPAGFQVSIVPTAGGDVRAIELIDPPMEPGRYVQLHPHRGRIAFKADGSLEEVWVMEGIGGRVVGSKDEGGSR